MQALVPISVWNYASPNLLEKDLVIDLGLLAEALIYYETVLITEIRTPEQLLALVKAMLRSDLGNGFQKLFADGNLRIHSRNFHPVAISDRDPNGVYTGTSPHAEIVLYLHPTEENHESLFPIYLGQPPGHDYFRDGVAAPIAEEINSAGRHARELLSVMLKTATSVNESNSEYGLMRMNAIRDLTMADRHSRIVQAYVDEVSRVKGIAVPPKITSSVEAKDLGRVKAEIIRLNISPEEIAALAGPKVGFQRRDPVVAALNANMLILDAMKSACDVFVASPTAELVGDKLFEATQSISASNDIISSMRTPIGFPDVRSLVNEDRIALGEIHEIRAQALPYRTKLHTAMQRDRDLDAIVAYHREIAGRSRLEKFGTSTLKLFGTIGAGAVGAAVGSVSAGPAGAAFGAAAGGVAGTALAGVAEDALGYLVDVVTGIRSGWRPIVFGEWFPDQIRKLLKAKKQ